MVGLEDNNTTLNNNTSSYVDVNIVFIGDLTFIALLVFFITLLVFLPFCCFFLL